MRERSSTSCSRSARARSTWRSHNPDHEAGPVGQRPPDLAGGGGLGLHIVERLASRWGVREGRSTAVWFELDCPSATLL